MESEFNLERFLAAYRVVQQVGLDALPMGDVEHKLRIFESVESTNQTVWELMKEAEEPIAIALEQAAGRGQWGRQWQSERGGLYLSVGLKLAIPTAIVAQLTLCTAWGIATALRHIPARLSGVTEGIPIRLKWMNDLVLHGYKLGGILTETRIQQEQIIRAVIGVGVNWTNPVPETGINLQSFLASHPTPLLESLEMLAAIVLQGIFTGVYYQQTGRMDEVLPQYVELLAHRNQPIVWNGQEWAIVDVTPIGELRVRAKFPENANLSGVEPDLLTEVLIQPGTINLGYPLSEHG